MLLRILTKQCDITGGSQYSRVGHTEMTLQGIVGDTLQGSAVLASESQHRGKGLGWQGLRIQGASPLGRRGVVSGCWGSGQVFPWGNRARGSGWPGLTYT